MKFYKISEFLSNPMFKIQTQFVKLVTITDHLQATFVISFYESLG